MVSRMDAENSTMFDHDILRNLPLRLSLGVVGILGNGLVCLTIYRAKFMHTNANYLIAHLAIADLLVCLTQAAFNDNYFRDAESTFLCVLFGREILVWFSLILSTMFIMSVTIERYVAIVHPLYYPRYVTPHRLRLAIAVTWVTSAALASLHIILPSYDLKQNDCFSVDTTSISSPAFLAGMSVHCFVFLWPISCCFFCYVKIMVNLRRSARRQRRDCNHAPANELLSVQRRIAIVLAIVATAYIALWSPILLSITFKTLGIWSGNDWDWTSILPIINSLINPIIYAFKYKEFQRGVKEVVFPWCFKRKRRVAIANDAIALG